MSRPEAGTRGVPPVGWEPGSLAYSDLTAPIRTAAYIRVSTDSDDQENSYEAQERYFSSVLSRNPMIENAGIYFDRGVTGTDLSHRTGFKRLLRHCEEGRIDRIICKSISRFARNTKDFVEALQRLKGLGVTVYFETPGFDTAEPSANFVLSTLAAIAEEESRSISQNVLDGLEHHYRMGEVRNCAIYGYRYNGEMAVAETGYRYRDIEVVEAEAEIVKRIFRSVESGKTFVGIARELNGEGIPAPDRSHRTSDRQGHLKDGPDEGWTGAAISRLVRNERYCGDVVVRKTYTRDHLTHKSERNQGEKQKYRMEGHHAPIISRELFDKVQDVLAEKTKGTVSGKRQCRPLSGILVCGECGRNFHARRGARDVVWACPTAERRNGKCLCHAQKRYGSQIRQTIHAAVAARQAQDSRKQVPDLMAVDGMLRPGNHSALCVPDAVGNTHFVFDILTRMRSMLEDDGLERRYAELKQSQTDSVACGAGGTEQAALKTGGMRAEEQLEALETARAEAEAFREHREKAVKWMQGLPGGEARWNGFLEGVSGEHLKAFFTRITAKLDGGYAFRWFDGVETEIASFDIEM